MSIASNGQARLNPKFITSGQSDRYIKLHASGLRPTERALLGFLKTIIYWDFAKRGEIRTVPIKVCTLALEFKRSRATIQRWIARLKEVGELEVVKQFAPNGREIAPYYTFPNFCAWIRGLKGHEQLEELKEEVFYSGDTADQASEVTSVPTCDDTQSINEAPTKQGLSYSKKITYIRFSKDFGKEDFLSVTGSVKYIPQLVGIIRKLRPGVDPDVIFNFFREWISKPEFVLRKGSNYVSIFWAFVKRCKVPFVGPYTPKPAQNIPDVRQTASSACYDDAKPPQGDTIESKFRSAIFEESPAIYKNWLMDAAIGLVAGELKITGKTTFATRYIAQNYEDLILRVAFSLGVPARFKA